MKFMKIVVIGLIFLLTVPVVSLSMAEEDLLLEAFTATGARPEAFDVTDWSVINRKFMDFSDMKHITEKVLRIFGAGENNFPSTQESDDMYRILTLEGMLDDDTHLRVIVQSVKLPEEYEKEPQTYLVVNVTGRDVGKLKVMKKKVIEAVNSSGGHSRITTCLTGAFYGKLNQTDKDKIIDKIREKLDIKEFEKMQDLETQSFVGYSPLISDGIEIMGENYNVNVAMRYSPDDDRTYIWMGVPVISVEY
ncbi:YwmB family TATA-box binding protein [Thermosediminibacter litoriperuensis]|uniref:TATA-box binding protein n=1 Tax=Thermosediminibacter litoriperuensis TaxID=291989 RepID=A0A5S5AY46_9FIRM|nr:YwmB family TATA-box binding protein [Thermosediminibacter litoriperuensis]TYP58798.1 TATA-box binding protein [Thermosediminibacter litoriperuensis]